MSAFNNPIARAALAAALLLPGVSAQAFELTSIQESTLRLDITASTVAAFHADNRDEDPVKLDDNYADLYNRINFQLAWTNWVAGLRLDTATYIEPTDPSLNNDAIKNNMQARYRDHYTIGKFYAGYVSPELEVTAGDSYVSLGRGLVLSMRKQDELGVDSTLQGGKIVARAPWGSVTAIGGIANPMMVDPATGFSLYESTSNDGKLTRYAAQDTIFGGRADANLEGYTLGVQGVRMMRGDIEKIGGVGATGAQRAFENNDIASLSLQAPLVDFGSLYFEGATQQLSGGQPGQRNDDGFAFYSSVNAGFGRITGVAELQHYRNFIGLPATVAAKNVTGLGAAFSTLRYNAAPSTENVDTDTRFNEFDRCVTGGRGRVDGRVNERLSLHMLYGHWATWGEALSSTCDISDATQNNVDDVAGGFDLAFEEGASSLFGQVGLRHDKSAATDALYYRELYVKGTAVKQLSGPWSLELVGRQRHRFQEGESKNAAGETIPWNEGEFYLSLRYSPWLIGAVGYEYTSNSVIAADDYFNGQIAWKYSSDSSLKLFVGQQRGALKCVSGTCRFFPAFEGAKLEWVQRY